MEREDTFGAMKSRADSVESEALRFARERPHWGQARVAEELQRLGHSISASGVRKMWQRHDMETTYKRLKLIERSGSPNVGILSEQQLKRLSRGDRTRRLIHNSSRIRGTEGTILSTRELIMHVAAEVFVEHGYAAAALRDIAKRAGLLPGSLYHHFESKADLFAAVHREGFRQLTAAVNIAVEGTLDPWERLERACCTHAELMLEGGAIASMTAVSLFSRYEPALQRRLNQDRAPYEDIFRQLIASLPSGKKVDPSLLRLCIFGALNWALTWYRRGRLSPTDIAKSFVAMLHTSTSSGRGKSIRPRRVHSGRH
jgi:AcrR family transcriptional regulator